jgi:uncharacterized protein
MKTCLVFLSLLVIFTSAPLTRPSKAQSLGTAVAPIFNGMPDTPFRIVGAVTVLSGPHQGHQISVFVEPRFFTLERVKSVFLQLAAGRPPEEASLSIYAMSNAEQLEETLRWFNEVKHFTFGDVPPPPKIDPGPQEPPLSASYFRGNKMERFYYYAKDGTVLHPDLKRTLPDLASADRVADLVYASMRGEEDVVDELLLAGANPDVKTKEGDLALVEASYWGSGHPKIVKRLLDAGADIDQTSSTGWTALMAAVFANRTDTIDLLLRRGANVNIISREGRNALILAVLRQNHRVTNLLLANHADPNVTDGYGKTALSIAKEQHDEELIRILKEAGAVR